MRNENLNSKIMPLWNTHFQNDQDVYAPLFYDEFQKGGLRVSASSGTSAKAFWRIPRFHRIDLKRHERVDLTCSPGHRRTSAICALPSSTASSTHGRIRRSSP